MVGLCVSLGQSCTINYAPIDLWCIRILQTSSLTQFEVGDPQCPPVHCFGSDNQPILQELYLRQKNTWRAVPHPTQQLMHRNLPETITDRIQQNHAKMQKGCEGFADNHDAVHSELARRVSRGQLSSRYPRRAAVRELKPLNNRAGAFRAPAAESICIPGERTVV